VTQKVYVVDDDSTLLQALRRLLTVRGFEVETFISAEDFICDADPPAAVCLLCDIKLSGMSGIELARRLVEQGSSLPIIFIAGEHSDELEQATQNVGGVAFLQKPVSAALLMETIRTVCR
jgi:FixJ family two-component response regulator